MAKSIRDLIALDSEESAKPRKAASLTTLDQEDEMPAAEAAPVSDGLPADFPRHEEGESTGDWWKKELSALTRPENWKRQALLAGRAAYEGVAGFPMMAADLGVATRNLVTGSDYQMPSEMNRESLNTILPHPQTASEKVAGFVESVLAGSRTPSPQVKNAAPTGFVSPNISPKQALLAEGREVGLKVPPASVSQSSAAKGVESVAGKASVAQGASIENQKIFNELAKKAAKLTGDEPITPEALHEVRSAAGKVYERISQSGEIVADSQYLDDLSKLGQSADEIAQAFPGANVGATKQINELVDSLLQDKFDAKAAMQYLRELRKMSGANLSGLNAADPAKQALGMAQKEAASTLEEMVMRHLSRNGMDDLAQSFDGARKSIAVSHTIENALNETTGNVVASKLAQQLAKGKPLSPELELIAKWGRAFPKASQEIKDSVPGASPLDWSLGGILSSVLKSPYAMLMAGVRPTARAIALSEPVQSAIAGSAVPYAGAPSVLGVAPSTAIQMEQQ